MKQRRVLGTSGRAPALRKGTAQARVVAELARANAHTILNVLDDGTKKLARRSDADWTLTAAGKADLAKREKHSSWAVGDEERDPGASLRVNNSQSPAGRLDASIRGR